MFAVQFGILYTSPFCSGHVNNLYNTAFWHLVHSGLSTGEAESRLRVSPLKLCRSLTLAVMLAQLNCEAVPTVQGEHWWHTLHSMCYIAKAFISCSQSCLVVTNYGFIPWPDHTYYLNALHGSQQGVWLGLLYCIYVYAKAECFPVTQQILCNSAVRHKGMLLDCICTFVCV